MSDPAKTPDFRAPLAPLGPLGGATPQVDRIGQVVLTERPDLALASLAQRQGQDKPFAAAAKKLFGAAPPGPGRWISAKDYTLLWTGPGQWLVEAPEATHEDIEARLKSAFGASASVAEQTGAWATFDIEGTGAVDLLERLSAVDVRAMQAGQGTRTVIEHIGAYLLCRTARTGFRVMPARSFGGALHHALVALARSVA